MPRRTPVAVDAAAPKPLKSKKAKLDPNETLSLVVAHGSFKKEGKQLPPGSPIQMTRAEKLHLDPNDETLVTEEVWAAMQMKADAEEVIAGAEDASEEG